MIFRDRRHRFRCYDEFGVLVAVFDLGWKELKIAMDYEGAHHWMSRARINHDIRKAEAVAELGMDRPARNC